MSRSEKRPTPFLRLRLIALGVGLGFLLRAVWGEYQAEGDARRFVTPDSPPAALAPTETVSR